MISRWEQGAIIMFDFMKREKADEEKQYQSVSLEDSNNCKLKIIKIDDKTCSNPFKYYNMHEIYCFPGVYELKRNEPSGREISAVFAANLTNDISQDVADYLGSDAFLYEIESNGGMIGRKIDCWSYTGQVVRDPLSRNQKGLLEKMIAIVRNRLAFGEPKITELISIKPGLGTNKIPEIFSNIMERGKIQYEEYEKRRQNGLSFKRKGEWMYRTPGGMGMWVADWKDKVNPGTNCRAYWVSFGRYDNKNMEMMVFSPGIDDKVPPEELFKYFSSPDNFKDIMKNKGYVPGMILDKNGKLVLNNDEKVRQAVINSGQFNHREWITGHPDNKLSRQKGIKQLIEESMEEHVEMAVG